MRCSATVLFVLCISVTFGQVTDFRDTDFSIADSIAEHYTAHSLIDLKTLAVKLTEPLPTEQEKFRAIYKWVCSNIGVEYELLTINKHNRAELKGDELVQWNKHFNKMVFKTLLQDQKTVCTGYAYLIKVLAEHADLHCEIVNGYAKQTGIDPEALGQVNHSWNEIFLNNRWYVCDATWSSGVFDLNANKFIKKYNDFFFLTEPKLFFQTHYAIDEKQNHVAMGR